MAHHNIFETDFSFDIELRVGAGAFVCGEETALLRSIEGKRGQPTPKPPFPAISGLWGKKERPSEPKQTARQLVGRPSLVDSENLPAEWDTKRQRGISQKSRLAPGNYSPINYPDSSRLTGGPQGPCRAIPLRGAQKGHEGKARTFLPPTECECGGHVVVTGDIAERRQVFELPKVKAHVTETRFVQGI